MGLLQSLQRRARANPQRIVFPEGEEERILKVAEKCVKTKTAVPYLLGDEKKIIQLKRKYKITTDFDIINPLTSPLRQKLADAFFELRKEKGVTPDAALLQMNDAMYFGTLLTYLCLADGVVSGCVHTTADTVRPALQIIKTREPFHKVSGLFVLLWKKKVYFFADCAVIIEPTPEELADIALDTAHNARWLGITPRVVFLSFSTHDNYNTPHHQNIKKALELVKTRDPKLLVDGEMQLDAAIVPEVGRVKCPNSPIKGDANVLIFPNLESANIGYKLVERFGKAIAIGPILQGLRKPVNDVSRGSTVEDIFDTTILTCIEAQQCSSLH